MYEAPKLVVYGQFRDLTKQTEACTGAPDWTGKGGLGGDSLLPQALMDRCNLFRS
jgi:hypothetical protein